MVAYNVQTAVDIKHHLIVAHEVTNVGTDRSQLFAIAQKAKAAVGTDSLDVVADRGYFKSKEILACDRAGITVTLPRTAPYRQSPERFYTVWTPVGKDRIGEM
jgi:transposase